MRTFNYASLFRSFRKLHGLTQVQMAESFGAGQTRISKIENGILHPDANEILHFMFLMGLDQTAKLEELLRDAPPQTEERAS